ncbi:MULTISPECIES: isoaspartyl peptidase/L-asparaginase [Pseudomonas]|uniref:isoaspartyl peptidase/L-asparaginase n=1 Tax=Gammaproteobacteria TaxID=1236 RepID=UPI001F0E413F|nr:MULTISPECIES: isoaspartyl peptidase/L-asparaginase [Pseudomonas]
MRHHWGWIITMLAATTGVAAESSAPEPAKAPIAIALHGGAGTLERANLGAEEEAAIRAALAAALDAGHAVLSSGGTALDAVTTANTGNMTAETALRVGMAAGRVFRSTFEQ